MIHTRNKYRLTLWTKFIGASLLTGFLAALLAIVLKHTTEHLEHSLFTQTTSSVLYILLFPITGLTAIYFLKKYLFKGRENKGIKEVFESVSSGKQLKEYKILSHFVNGLLTVSFGGATGIEVSTVVSTAAIGNVASRKERILKKHKTELICAAVAAGVAVLFSSPLAGILFSYEVISKKVNKFYIVASVLAVSVAFAMLSITGDETLFKVNITGWKLYALPYFVLLGIISGVNATYLTRCVLFIKKRFAAMQSYRNKIIIGAVLLSITLLVLPQLYGDGYHAIKDGLEYASHPVFSAKYLLIVVLLLVIKPIITSVTLGAGGDGGVFAPSIFIGAFLGLLTATVINSISVFQVIPLNFMIAGMAAMLSASIHAPLTALFLVCGIVKDYTLFVPLAIVSFTAKLTAARLLPYNVYTYKEQTPYAT
nr:chloride channel protein [uncultured Flavobacterium sp.]